MAQERTEALLAFLADPESLNTLNLVPRRARKEYTPNTMYDVLKGFARRVPLPRMI